MLSLRHLPAEALIRVEGVLLRWFELSPSNRRPDTVSATRETECRLGRHPDDSDTTSFLVVAISCWLPRQAG